MYFRKTFFVFFICFFLFFSSFLYAGIFKTGVKVFIVKESVEIILKNYEKKIAKQIVLKNKDKLISYIEKNPKMRQKVFDEIDDISNNLISKEVNINKAAAMKSYSIALKNDINNILPDVVPKGIRLPKNGIWAGEKGNSRFFPSKLNKDSKKSLEEIYEATNKTGIKYNKGIPDFRNVSEKSMHINGLNGENSNDFNLVYDKIIKDNISIRGQTFKNRKEVINFLSKERLTIHHENGGNSVRIIDRDIHGIYRHTGGASELRKKGG